MYDGRDTELARFEAQLKRERRSSWGTLEEMGYRVIKSDRSPSGPRRKRRRVSRS
jgi:hypothetical protein